jgi:hypothetical protein
VIRRLVFVAFFLEVGMLLSRSRIVKRRCGENTMPGRRSADTSGWPEPLAFTMAPPTGSAVLPHTSTVMVPVWVPALMAVKAAPRVA